MNKPPAPTGLNKMCKAHFHPFSVIISLFHAMGVKIYKKKKRKLKFLVTNGVPPPPWVPKRGASAPLKHPDEKTGNGGPWGWYGCW
jgi:hypothetical protein